MVYTVSQTWRDPVKLLQTTMPLSFAVQTTTRIFLILTESQPFVELRKIMENFYADNDAQKVYTKVSTRNLVLAYRIIIILTMIYTICFVGPMVYCLTNFLVYNSYLTPHPIMTPFINQQSTFGFAFNFALQSWMSTGLFLGFSSIDGQSILYVFHSMALADRFDIRVKHLCLELNERKNNQRCLELRMKEIFKCYTEIKEYCFWLKKYYLKPSFIIVVSNTYAICCCGISILVLNEYNVFGLALQASLILLVVCTLCTLFNHHHQRLSLVLYEFEWYKLPLAQQKSWLIFMMDVQQSMNVDLPFIGIIDMELLIKVKQNFTF